MTTPNPEHAPESDPNTGIDETYTPPEVAPEGPPLLSPRMASLLAAAQIRLDVAGGKYDKPDDDPLKETPAKEDALALPTNVQLLLDQWRREQTQRHFSGFAIDITNPEEPLPDYYGPKFTPTEKLTKHKPWNYDWQPDTSGTGHPYIEELPLTEITPNDLQKDTYHYPLEITREINEIKYPDPLQIIEVEGQGNAKIPHFDPELYYRDPIEFDEAELKSYGPKKVLDGNLSYAEQRAMARQRALDALLEDTAQTQQSYGSGRSADQWPTNNDRRHILESLELQAPKNQIEFILDELGLKKPTGEAAADEIDASLRLPITEIPSVTTLGPLYMTGIGFSALFGQRHKQKTDEVVETQTAEAVDDAKVNADPQDTPEQE